MKIVALDGWKNEEINPMHVYDSPLGSTDTILLTTGPGSGQLGERINAAKRIFHALRMGQSAGGTYTGPDMSNRYYGSHERYAVEQLSRKFGVPTTQNRDLTRGLLAAIVSNHPELIAEAQIVDPSIPSISSAPEVESASMGGPGAAKGGTPMSTMLMLGGIAVGAFLLLRK